MAYRIYPPIGIARLGNDPSHFFIGPERPGHPGIELSGAGIESEISEYKNDDDKIKRQAARFRLFEMPDAGGTPQAAQLPAGATVEWTVHLVNKKAAVQRTGTPLPQPNRPQMIPNPADVLIDPGSRTIAGANATAVKFDTGEYRGRRVPLGEIRSDGDQNLIVLGGFGFSSSPTNADLPSFYTNPGWHDDTSDGSVKARIRMADGSIVEDVAGAWVIVGPPDYAPDVQGVVTLYEILAQVGNDHFGIAPPAQVSFTRDVFPLLFRTRRLQWVNDDPNWSSVSDNWPNLADAAHGATQLRALNADIVREIESVLSRYKLTKLQNRALDQWVAGNFQSDWTGVPLPPTGITADGLTRAALQGTVGQGFFPGIEGGVLVKDHTLYRSPFDFRIDHAQASPGDLTALMAVPWQADFYDCGGNWWPSQRPDDVRTVVNSTNRLSWDRGIIGHFGMVNNFPKLGYITAQRDAQGNVVFVETQRSNSVPIV